MKQLFVGAAVLLIVVLKFAIAPLFYSLPSVAVAGSTATVGKVDGDFARYELHSSREIYATNLGYDFSKSGIGDLEKLGKRGLITYADPHTYEVAFERQCKTGQCMGSILGGKNSVRTLLLIPQDKSAMEQMGAVSLRNGKRFVLNGRDMSLLEANLNGQPVSISMSGAGFFLVESIRLD